MKLKGKPRNDLEELTRSSRCKHKDATLPDRTAGWQFAIDPISQSVLGATEHSGNERNTDKVHLLQAAQAMPNMTEQLLLHDDACHSEALSEHRRGILLCSSAAEEVQRKGFWLRIASEKR